MKNVLTAAEVFAAEKKVFDSGIDVMFLRTNAALAVSDAVKGLVTDKHTRVALFCGRGGNGYDGIVAAIRLHMTGVAATVYLVGHDGSGDIAPAVVAARGMGVPVLDASEFHDADIVVDAIFGIGLKRPIDGDTAKLIDMLNELEAIKLAVDIPSGLDPDTGEVMGSAFRADITVTFTCYKQGMLFGRGRELCGDVTVVDVGVPTTSKVHVYEDDDFKPFHRRRNTHKGDCGRVYVIGGSASMVGAPMLSTSAAHAATLNGAGTVTLCAPKIHRVAVASRCTLSMMNFLSDTPDGYIRFVKEEFDAIIERADAIVIGMGMGATPDLRRMIEYLCKNFDGVLVIDADGLNALAGDASPIVGAKAKVIVTPHVGEFRRLTGKSATIEYAVELTKRLGCLTVLKSATTVITDGNEVRLNIAGTPAMSKGGTGDVLAGCIAALACSFSPIDAAIIACYRNGMGAQRAVSSYRELMLTPKEMLRYAKYDEI